ncbi:MAG: hypothetical protein ABI663_06885 [Chryseolinea sp.]
MRKYSILFLSGLILTLFTLAISACSDDDEPATKPKLSFSESTLTVTEGSSGTIEVEVELDKPASEDITITYELGGSAIDAVTGDANDINSDYEILSDYLEVEIEKGETTGVIEIGLYSDFSWEGSEVINISIESVNSNEVEITREDEIEIVIEQEDGIIVLLEWPRVGLDSLADMDIVLRAGSSTSTLEDVISLSADEAFTGGELVFIPKAPDIAAYGLSYVYYEGTYNRLPFKATFADLVNGSVEAAAQRQIFEKTYTKANLNKWTDYNATLVVQTLEKSGTGFATPSQITVPASGSRVASGNSSTQLNPKLKKTKRSPEEIELLHSMLKKLN